MLNDIITSVLRREGKIALPSIGIIVRADFDGETTYLFTPMAVKADTNLIAAFVEVMDISHGEAINMLDCFVDFVRGVIAKNGKYHIKGVGDIMCNESKVFYFTPLHLTLVTEPAAAIVEEVKNEVLENEVVLEEVVERTERVVAPESTERMNERFQSTRLGEIMEGGSNKRFYDKVHSQVVSDKEEEKKEKPKEEVTPLKRKGLYDIYDKGFKHEAAPSLPKSPVTPPPVSIPVIAEQPVVSEPVAVVTPPLFNAPEPAVAVVTKKKKTDIVLVISIIVIVVGLAFIGYFYYMQQNIEL